MPDFGSELEILGLLIDILGAIILVVPDVPYLRGRTRQGDIEDCIHWLGSKWGLHPVKPGFGIIKEEIENLYEININDDIDRLRIVLESLSPTPEYRLYILPTEDIDDAYTPEKDLPWSVVAGEL